MPYCIVQVKALNKKIRQVEELEAKVSAGSVVPTDEQRQKLARKPVLLAELAEVRNDSILYGQYDRTSMQRNLLSSYYINRAEL